MLGGVELDLGVNSTNQVNEQVAAVVFPPNGSDRFRCKQTQRIGIDTSDRNEHMEKTRRVW